MLDIDYAALAEEITVLSSLQENNMSVQISIDGAGKTIEVSEEILNYYKALNESLNQLITTTIELLQDVKDGFIELEEAAGDMVTAS